MKRFLFFIFIVFAVLFVCYLFKKTGQQTVVLANKQLQTNHQVLEKIKTNPAKDVDVKDKKIVLNATLSQNIKVWQEQIKNLRLDPTMKGDWIMWQSNGSPPLTFAIGNTNSKFAVLDSDMVNIFTKNDDGDIRSTEIHSVWMDISETRPLGDSLMSVMGKDPAPFDAWCDKVGNHWLDAPLYSSGNSPVLNGKKVSVFAVKNTFNNEKPWYILYLITDR